MRASASAAGRRTSPARKGAAKPPAVGLSSGSHTNRPRRRTCDESALARPSTGLRALAMLRDLARPHLHGSVIRSRRAIMVGSSRKVGQRGARQMRTVPSALAEAMRLPSGKNATPDTWAAWPSYLRNSLPVVASQTRTVLWGYQAPETRRLLSGEHATQMAEALMYVSNLPVSTSQLCSATSPVADS